MCCQNSLQIKKLSKNGGAFLEALKQGHVEFDPTGELFIELADIRAQLHEHYEEIFCEHYRDLVAFKNEFGHCKVPSNYENNPSLGSWCRTMRSYYNNIRLSPDRIERLEKIGFVWNVTNEKFEERYRELLAFKKEFGHDKVPTGRLYANNPSLGRWCQRMRYLYSSTHPGINRLSPDRIARLEEIGFKWKINETLFEQRCHDLQAFKKEFGHCKVPSKYAVNQLLATFCTNTRHAYNTTRPGKNRLSPDQIKQLEETGFKWNAHDEKFEERCQELEAFKEEHGHWKVTQNIQTTKNW